MGGFFFAEEAIRTASGPSRRGRVDGVSATPRHRDAVFMITRESTDRVERPRRAAQVLEKNTYVESGQKLIKLGDKSVAWDDSFRLFFTTKLGNPHYSPEVMAKTMLINYSVTQVRSSAF